jgi:D-alanyl-D-alanine carboxypeptidase/D-alanyl-D-alanine-endopeptidase (penicillin-binding protein 4)
MSLRAALAGVAATLLLAPAAPQSWAQALPEPVLRALALARLNADALAVAALPLHNDAVPWGWQPTRLMQPGSSMKLVTSIVALDRLGPNHRGFTELRSAAPLVDGTLQGDLALVGGGDVELGLPQWWGMLLELQHAGVRHISGNLLLDRTRYRPARPDLGAPPFDASPEFPYNVIPDALNLAGSLLPLELRATATGVQATTVPRLPGLAFDSRMALVDARCQDWDDHWQPVSTTRGGDALQFTLNGAFPRNCTVRTDLQLLDRTELAERLFRQVWQGLGGTWAGHALEQGAPSDARVLARRDGRPWGELLRHQNKQSDNAWTRVLFMELGAARSAAEPSRTTADLAAQTVHDWFAEQGIPSAGLVMDNGSGLSRSERISPLQMARLLVAASRGRHAADFAMSLPTVGVDGTMRNRLKESPAAGWARLKTGTLRNVVALAGYVSDPQGRPWAVAMMINDDEGASRGRPVLDALIDSIARLGVPGTAFVGVGEIAAGGFGPGADSLSLLVQRK